ncbi:MAG: flagellar hook-basal body complex protein FliE [Paracoccus sp. (in: a-proteobacteria)]|uniref:flagellar hook-basal body complex protein FliE n=1 Tax=Paracoccus sp. TaxID=267 RepID=UPI0026DFE0C8|nr:flagellar hook-basal body complex protein FliE [Paracoccus sp. (in: a-proteobacteria)]MDO5621231.1 flagellar hook-basal body complex protein FliE [Paracoccus sp. (in: a-proteobacteria)]
MISAINAASAYQTATARLGAAQPETGVTSTIRSFEQVMQQADAAAVGAMSGTTDTTHLVQSIAEAELALDTVTAIRDKVVEAYQELLRMPV